MDAIFAIISCALAVVYGVWFSPRTSSVPKSVVKTVSIALLGLIAVLAGGPFALILGLAFGALGDFWLSRDGERAFLFGLVSFAIGHIAYVVLLMQFGGRFDLSLLTIFVLGFAGAMAAVLWPRAADLRWPVMGYVAIIAAMGVLAVGMEDGPMLGTFAALSFIVSDAILSVEMFILAAGAPIRRVTSRLVWLTYFAAQGMFLMAFGWQIAL